MDSSFPIIRGIEVNRIELTRPCYSTLSHINCRGLVRDSVKAAVPKGKYQGTHIGRLASVRADGYYSIKTKSELARSNYKYCQVIQHADGYNYAIGNAIFDLKSA